MMKIFTGVVLLLLAAVAVVIRWQLFSRGILYGDAAAKMASLTVAGIIVLAGALLLRVGRPAPPPPPQQQESTGASDGSTGPGDRRGAQAAAADSALVTITAVLGLATTAYAVGELVAPNTPVAVAQAACSGVPFYGARYFAVTSKGVGANSRRGPGREYQQVKKYRGDCTLGFDGYCVGAPEEDLFIGYLQRGDPVLQGGEEARNKAALWPRGF
ncbi:hypothetical protein [Actinomadura bangladeshensis]|uniref:Uncharacterized protein n=1 Tax=Actinomadura bangladeshensis TaxID=453573 RepID=A0A4R4N0Q3_9ACTN|nr:hypothetical protein [Actinomadura bangladeshensis]TDC02209.1 hypothetical protein E1284_39605 [Actinomadura bangladeshensis]